MTEAAVRAALREQGRACADLGSPFMARLCAALADVLRPGLPVADRLFAWEGEIGPRGQSLPLRLAGALHALRRAGHPGLAAIYPPGTPDEPAFRAALAAALEGEAEAILAVLDSPPQTNEVRRSAALIPAALWLAERFGLPLRLWEVGASAGLNLGFERYALEADGWRRGPGAPVLTLRPDWTGPPPPDAALRVAGRRGADLRPLDPARDGERLMAYLWPDQPERVALTAAALDAADTRVEAADAGDWLAADLAPRADEVQLVFHTIAWQYFPPATAERAEAALLRAGAIAGARAPVARLGLESDADGPGAALTLTLWPGGESHAMGRADFHGRWVRWTPPAGPGAAGT